MCFVAFSHFPPVIRLSTASQSKNMSSRTRSYSYLVPISFCMTFLFSFAAPHAQRKFSTENTAVGAANFKSERVTEQKISEIDREQTTLVCWCLLLPEQERILKEQSFFDLATVCNQRLGVRAKSNKNKGIIRADKPRKKIFFSEKQSQQSSLPKRILRLLAQATRQVLKICKFAIERILSRSPQIRTAEENEPCSYGFKGLVERMDSVVMSLPKKDQKTAVRLLTLIRSASRETLRFLLTRINRLLR